MMFLMEFNVLRPDPGLFFWTVVIFLLFWFIIGKFAFKPIINALKTRNNDIQAALDEAQLARKEMADLKAQNDAIMAEAREERAKVLREANEMKNSIINEARNKAKEEAGRLIATAKTEIAAERKAAMTNIKNEVGSMAISIAENILRKELAGDPDKKAYAESLVNELNLN